MENHKDSITNFKGILYDTEFIVYINSLSKSIKEYYEVTKNIIINKKLLINLVEEELNASKSIIDKIKKEKNFNQINLFNSYNENIKKIFNKLKININSEEKNISFFFNDAKIIFSKLKEKRQELILKNRTKRKLASTNNTFNSFNSNFTNNLHTNINMNTKDTKLSSFFNNNNCSNISTQYFNKIDDGYSKNKNSSEIYFNTYENNTNTLKKRNCLINQNTERTKRKTRNQIFSTENISEFVVKKNVSTNFKDKNKNKIKQILKVENNNNKINELMKYINIYKKEIDILKNENTELKHSNLLLKKDLNKDNNNNNSEKNSKTKINSKIKENMKLKKSLDKIKLRQLKISNCENNSKNNSKNNNTSNKFLYKNNLNDSNINAREAKLLINKINIIKKKLLIKDKKIRKLNSEIISLKNKNKSDISQLSNKNSEFQENLKNNNNLKLLYDNINDSNKIIEKKESNKELNNNQNIANDLKKNYEKKINEINIKNKNIEKIYKKCNNNLNKQITNLKQQIIDKDVKISELNVKIEELNRNVIKKEGDQKDNQLFY